MKKQIIAAVALLVSTNVAFAADQCTKGEIAKLAALGGGVGLTVGAVVGIAAVATTPVAAAGAPLAGTYFTVGAGKAVFGSFAAKSLIPAVTFTGVSGGALGYLVHHGLITQQCKESLMSSE